MESTIISMKMRKLRNSTGSKTAKVINRFPEVTHVAISDAKSQHQWQSEKCKLNNSELQGLLN